MRRPTALTLFRAPACPHCFRLPSGWLAQNCPRLFRACLCRRKSINVLKDMFREEMTKPDWQLVMRLKKVFKID